MKHEKNKIFLRLDNKTSEEIKEVPRILRKAGETLAIPKSLVYEIELGYINLHFREGKNYWTCAVKNVLDKTEISLQDFKELFVSEEDLVINLNSNETIDTVGNCANCGVEFHIHKTEVKTLQNALQTIATLHSDKDELVEGLKEIESFCDNQNPSHEIFWRISYSLLQKHKQ